MARQKITRHHLIPRYYGGNNNSDNILKIKENQHRALHTLLDDWWKPRMPIEQMSELFRLVSKPLQDDVKFEIDKILRLAEELWYEAYNPNCYNLWN